MIFMRLVMIIVLGGAALMLNSCINTKIYSMKDPAAAGIVYNKLIVQMGVDKISIMQNCENAIVDELKENKVQAMPKYRILPPLRTYSPEEEAAILGQNGIEAALIVTIENTNITTKEIPATIKTVKDSNSTKTIMTKARTVESVAGYEFKLVLVDVKTGAKVWQGELAANIVFEKDLEGVIYYTAGEIVRSLIEDKVIKSNN